MKTSGCFQWMRFMELTAFISMNSKMLLLSFPKHRKLTLKRSLLGKARRSTFWIVSDDSMLELFRQEAETQIALLTQELLILEANPQSDEALEALMRAAHSIK